MAVHGRGISNEEHQCLAFFDYMSLSLWRHFDFVFDYHTLVLRVAEIWPPTLIAITAFPSSYIGYKEHTTKNNIFTHCQHKFIHEIHE